MTVAELMEKLAALDPNMEVMVDGYEYGVQSVESAETKTILIDYWKPADCGGPHQVNYPGFEEEAVRFGKQIVFLIER